MNTYEWWRKARFVPLHEVELILIDQPALVKAD